MYNRKVFGTEYVPYILTINVFCVVRPGENGLTFLSAAPEETVCDVCQKMLKRKDYLKQHMKTHAADRTVWRCPREGCDRTYTTVFNLQSHILSFHEERRPFVCEHAGCGKTFAMKVSTAPHRGVWPPSWVPRSPGCQGGGPGPADGKAG